MNAVTLLKDKNFHVESQMTMALSKSLYDALGNVYCVMPPGIFLKRREIVHICKMEKSDGLLVGEILPNGWFLRIFNSDGSEAEKSGNGVRIFATYLVENNFEGFDVPIFLKTLGGNVTCIVSRGEKDGQFHVYGDLGQYILDPQIKKIFLNKDVWCGYVVEMGNPHFVAIVTSLDIAVDEIG
ncbi:MAG: hypothetical protein LBG86_01635, partial [Puniceicoccales bacterium]|nr:hypothetical protein [Puniceicoccales bacterium]